MYRSRLRERWLASYGSTAAEESAVTVAVVLKQQLSVTTTHKNTKEPAT